ncbi:OmpA family protein [Candidatus Parabeggiatoa sp. HSG14]|uniref:OmpA family protein n=1 Tax=Candidatus Parabeggiatoa sp. HSG14 TaxID=3055593 RepID=UPI0025A8316F|nr:OmpA family protein [Thiotrichales bacterium HSG14]
MSDYFNRKILIGVVTGTLLSTAVTSSLASSADTHHLVDSRGNPILTKRLDECVETPKTPNTPAKLFKKCGDIIDRDEDGIFDDEDVCPDNTPEELTRGVYQSGPKKGCPIDSDNDGVPDYRDDCPRNTPLEVSKGVDSRGCPLDTDQDGVANYRDSCPGTPFGIKVDENGCARIDPKPVVRTLSTDILFDIDSATLTSEALPILDDLLHQIEGLFIQNVEVVGHTDYNGTDEHNQDLSERRARTVVIYLTDRGVPTAKINSWGDGESNPIASNEDSEGRTQNRRVEVRIMKFERR